MISNSKVRFYWSGLPLESSIYASFGLSFFLVLVILLLRGFLPPQVPLFYGEPVGEGQLVKSTQLILAPIFSLLVTLINTFAASKINDDFIQKILVISSLFVSILVLITLVRIVFLVGYL